MKLVVVDCIGTNNYNLEAKFKLKGVHNVQKRKVLGNHCGAKFEVKFRIIT